MSEQQLRAQLKGLEHPSALLRRQATLGVFALLAKAAPQHQQHQELVRDVLLSCLTDTHPVSIREFILRVADHTSVVGVAHAPAFLAVGTSEPLVQASLRWAALQVSMRGSASCSYHMGDCHSSA
jgi:hypothetical protein